MVNLPIRGVKCRILKNSRYWQFLVMGVKEG